MSFKSRLLSFIQNDNSIYQLLLIGLFIASPSLHYLCFANSFDPFWLRAITSGLCLLSLSLSFSKYTSYYNITQYATIISFLVINNCILLSKNGFDHVYLFSAITVFIALTLFCKKRWEFVTICVLNLIATIIAYITAPKLDMSAVILIVLLLIFTVIGYVSFLVITGYNIKFKKAVTDVVELNQTLIVNDEMLRESGTKLNALINSLNDIIFEFDENKICLNTWFSKKSGRVIDPEVSVGKRLCDILGTEKAKKFNDALDHVIEYRMPTSVEFISDFGTGRWFIAKLTPVFNNNGDYTHRISASITDISEQKKYEEALKQNELLLIEAQAIAKTGNWWFDHTTREVYWSESLYSILEVDTIPEDGNKYDYYTSLIHSDDQENAYKYFRTIHTTLKNQFEHRLITPKGNLKYFKIIKGTQVVDENGRPVRSFGVLQDITEAKASEKRIKASQRELLEAQKIAKIGNWKWDVTLNNLEWSNEINNIFEIDQKTADKSNFIRLLVKYTHPAERQLLKQRLKKVAESINISYEYRIITELGNAKHVSIIIGKIIRRENGSVRKIIGTLQDITDRKQAEIDYQRTENKYKLVLETIKLPALSVDNNGDIIFCNRYMADLLGYEKHELLGLNWADNFVPQDLQYRIAELFATDSFKTQNINTVICRSGEQRTISWQNTLSYDENGNIREVTAIGEDITDREKATEQLISAKEQAEKSSQFKSEFLSIMSHEIRTPMNAVIGTTNLLLCEDPKPDQLEYLNTLKFSGENLLAIINDILDYNKIEAGKLELSKISFNIYHLVQKIKQSFYSKASEKGFEIRLSIDNDIPAYLTGDQVRLSQVLNNLLSNAVKFTHNGHVGIRLEKQKITDKVATIKFIIEDTGIGIPSESLGIIFDPFEQESHVSSNGYGGTGLGLAITKRLVELHKSTISVSSKQGEGTEFTFTINFVIDHKDHSKDNEIPVFAPGSTSDLHGMRILVVDDNKMNLMIASKFLKRWQAEVDEALDGKAAIEMVRKFYYDLIIMDLQMPLMDGFETARIIKRTNPHVPIIALTADAMPETHSKAFAAGMCDYLTKPFVPQILFDKVAKYYVPLEVEK